MKPEVTTVRKIRWYHWYDDVLVVQVFIRGVPDKSSDAKGMSPQGSVKYVFTNVDTKEKVDKIVEDVRNGAIK